MQDDDKIDESDAMLRDLRRIIQYSETHPDNFGPEIRGLVVSSGYYRDRAEHCTVRVKTVGASEEATGINAYFVAFAPISGSGIEHRLPIAFFLETHQLLFADVA